MVPVMPPPVATRSAILQQLPSSNRAREHSRVPRVLSYSLRILCIAVLCVLCGSNVAQAESKQKMRSLDEQVQEIKSDVLSIAAELSRLEEKLLYPSNTQVSVFVSLANGREFRLDSVRIQINGELVAHHIYSFKELEALEKGGVQRLFTGNVATGEHQLEVEVAGKLSSGSDYRGVERFAFSKEAEPKLVELSLAARDTGAPIIKLGGN